MKNPESKNSHEHWLSLVEEQEKSGLSQKAFCQQKNLNLSQFVYYRLRSRKQKAITGSMAAFIPVKVAHPKPTHSEIKLSLPNGFQCVFPSNLDTLQLKRMIGVLLSC